MDIQPQHIALTTLFHKRLFRIPQYQRAYSWETKHRKALFEDILRSGSSENGHSHFMATIVGLRREVKTILTDEYQIVEIVDGQQRITTLILLFKAIAKTLDACDRSEEEKKIKQEIDGTLVKSDDVSLLLLQTNHDTSHYFSNYLREGNYPPSSTARTLADRELLKAMKECENFVEECKNSENDWRGGLLKLINHLKNRLTFILHEIDNEALVYTVFEVLNSRGLDVSWFDRLKSMLMAIVFKGATGTRDEIIKEIHQLWSDIYRIVGLRQGLSTESLRFAATLWSEDCPNRILGEEAATNLLVDQSIGGPRDVIGTTKRVKSITESVDDLLANDRRNAVTKIAHARLVAVAVNHRSDWGKSEKEQLLRRWESVTFRIFGMSRRDARTGVGDYVRLSWHIVQKKQGFDQTMEALSKIGEKYPITEAVRQLRKADCYNGWQDELRYFMYRYEEYLAKEDGQKLSNVQWERIWETGAVQSIEHISPQSGSQNYVHWLGNLLLLPPGVNARLSDRKPEDKHEQYTQTGLLIARDVAERIIGGEERRWRRREVINRENDLLNWAQLEWVD